MSFKSNWLSFLFIISILFSRASATVEINSSNLFIPSSLSGVKLFHDERGFIVEKDGKIFPVKAECMDNELRNLSDEDLYYVLGLKVKIEIDGEELILTKFSPEQTRKLASQSPNLVQLSAEDSMKIVSQIPASNYIQIFQYDDGSYGLHLQPRILGGGGFGAIAGAIVGKFVVHAAAGAVAGVVAIGVTAVAGPVAGGAAGYGVWGVMAPSVEAASTVVALAAGITAGVATGPI